LEDGGKLFFTDGGADPIPSWSDAVGSEAEDSMLPRALG